jgi:hypothetical protein
MASVEIGETQVLRAFDRRSHEEEFRDGYLKALEDALIGRASPFV